MYAPDISKPITETESFYQHIIIVLGDFNARIGNDVTLGIKKEYNKTTVNGNDEILIDFCARNIRGTNKFVRFCKRWRNYCLIPPFRIYKYALESCH